MPAKREMPKWTKAPEQLVTMFDKMLSEIPSAEMRKMFGYPVAFAAGQMFCGLFQSSMMLRLSDTDRTAFMDQYGSKLFEPMPGRPMREYVVVPERLLQSGAELKAWIAKSHAYASSLPPKAGKAAKGPVPKRTK
jgi:TfoX/Sxy family transcriptional regulator of competence genes